MVVKLRFKISMRNGDKKIISVEKKDPKGYLVDKVTNEKKEISLTDKEVQVEYTKKIMDRIEKKKPILLMDSSGNTHVLSSFDISSIDIELG